MLNPGSNATRASELKQAFMRHLPERIGAIEENWRSLTSEGWDQAKLNRLFQRIQDLAGSSGKFGLIQVSESVFSLEQYFRQLVVDDRKPGPDQYREVNALLNSLKAAVEQARTSPSSPLAQTGGRKTRIHMLRIDDSLAPGLGAALESLGCIVQKYRSADDMLDAFETEIPDALIVDAQALDKLEPLKSRLNKIKADRGNAPPMTVISNTRNLDVRLHAMRAGAGSFFVPPLDLPSVASRIKQLATPNPPQSYRIMIVDDDPSQADFAAAILRKADMETCTVTEPMQVLNTLDTFRPDLILMDLYMPEADGMELTSIIREQNEFVGIPIVFVSGEQDTDKQLDALSVGGDDFIAKPIRPRHLMSTIKNRVQRARALQKQVSAASARDPVTGLFNRRHFFERLDNAVASTSPQPTARGVVFASLDAKEDIQQQIGIGQTDALQAEIGSQIAALSEPQDVCARLDDNGFAIMAKRPLSKDLRELAESLRTKVAEYKFENVHPETRPTLSVGICYFEAAPDDASGLIGRAQNACRQAAENGGDQVRVYGEGRGGEQSSGEQQDPLELVREALAEDGFQVLFQPFVDLHDRESENYQMILRLRTDEGDQLNTAEFMPVARQAGLARDIDHWLLGRALDVLDERRQSGSSVRLLINLAVDSLRDEHSVEWLRDQLRKRLLVGTGLILEFNLVDVASDLRGMRVMIDDLKSMGIATCLARFGHNDASYKISHYLGAEFIKVSEKLLAVDAKVIASLTKRIHQIGSRVIVPNVDDPRLIGQQWLSGADYVQGNAVQRPQESPAYDFSEEILD